MATSIDTNVLIALWNRDDALNLTAQRALDAAFERGSLLISAPVFAELLAFPAREEAFLDSFLRDTGIQVDWDLNESIWRIAGRAFKAYAARRRKQGDDGPRRVLADFLVGAHALRHALTLLTLDARLYCSAFPHLRITTI
jgi:predicted nucleic acid-binding protein